MKNTYNEIKSRLNLLIALFLGFFLLYALVKRGMDLNLIKTDFLFPYFDYIFWLLLGLLLGYCLSIRIIFKAVNKKKKKDSKFSDKYSDLINGRQNNN